MSQDNPQISTTPPLPGLQLVQDLNKALQTLATDFSGATDPAAIAWPYSTWADTGTGTLKRRNAANSAWMIERNLFEDLRRTASATDTTAGRILKVGDFGVGIGGTAQITVDNVDRIDIPTGLYRVNNATTGAFPANSGSHYGTLIVEAYNLTSGAESFCQTFTRALNTPQRWFRYYAYNLLSGSPGWSDWVELYHSGNLDSDLQWRGTPIGVELPFHPNAPLPPTNNSNYRFIVLTAGLTGAGKYNNGVLTGETVTGSDPTITATATVSLVGSPMDGQTIDLINTSRVFLRPGPAAGPIVDSQNLVHYHQITFASNSSLSGSGAQSSVLGGPLIKNSEVSGGDEARPRYIPRVYLMRIL